MTKTIHFTKMHGAGNDYIYIDVSLCPVADPEELARRISHRHTGVGSDGLVLIDRTAGEGYDCSMRIFNADGSEALMCGNASRCIGRYLWERGYATGPEVRLLTLSGVKTLTLHTEPDAPFSVTVDMLSPQFTCPGQCSAAEGGFTERGLSAAGHHFRGTFVSMGNPHCVIFTPDAATLDVALYGAALERDPLFPERCNIEFATVSADRRSIRTRVWERGSGITMACGTGACATAVAAAITGRASRQTDIVMDGGTLGIQWRESDGHVLMTGPAETVCEGEFYWAPQVDKLTS